MNSSMIISANSVSTTRRKREAERSVNWTVEETQVLLCAWSDERVQKSLAENLRNRHVFKHLSARMSEMGFSRSPHQCRLRVKTLKANYVRAKLHRTVNATQPCTFRYFAEMDAVLGRRAVDGEGGGYFISPEGRIEQHATSISSITSVNGTGSIPPLLHANTEVGGRHFEAFGQTEERGGRQSWPLDSEVKVEDGEVSTDEFEFSNAGFTREKQEVFLEPSIHADMSGSQVETSLSTPSPHVAPPPPPPPPPPLVQSASPPPPPVPPAPCAPRPPESTCLEPVLKHLSQCFQGLVSETRGLLVQLERQREEQARWHQELLSDWLQREERRQREAAEREERREKARMEHEIRVLELLTSLGRENRCRCGGGGGGGGAEAPGE